MKINYLVKNFIYLIAIILLFGIGAFLFRKYNSEIAQTFELNYPYFTLIHLISFGGIGGILGLESFLKNYKKKGKWRINISKLIILGIPSFAVAFSFIWVLLGVKIDFYLKNDYAVNAFVISNVIFGHTLISSFYKE